MRFGGLRLGWALTGSHHTVAHVFPVMERLRAEGAEIIPILSQTLATTATRYGDPETWFSRVEEITGQAPLTTIPEVEPFGPNRTLDLLAVVPCTGNTMAKLANAINDTAVTMAVKAQLRNGRPVVLSITTNDALGLNAVNLGRLLNAKNIYFVPFGQDDPLAKPNSLVAHLDLVPETIEAALAGRQLQPLLRSWPAGER
ncbi:MAG: dipicolinate synthase subunit B [Bacillota bacterium]|nr:dipicolinate synthase subunit B [Bacillota bacterium]